MQVIPSKRDCFLQTSSAGLFQPFLTQKWCRRPGKGMSEQRGSHGWHVYQRAPSQDPEPFSLYFFFLP